MTDTTVATTGSVFSGPWWKAAGIRAARSAIVIAIPYVAGATAGPLPYWTIASAAGMGAVLSILTSLAGLAELQPTKQHYFLAILTRVTKTVAQALVAALATDVLFTQVNWSAIAALSLTSGLGSLLLALLSTLPEADQPAVATLTGGVFNITNASAPVTAPATGAVVSETGNEVTAAVENDPTVTS